MREESESILHEDIRETDCYETQWDSPASHRDINHIARQWCKIRSRLSVLGAPELKAVLQMGSHESVVEEDNHLLLE